MKTKIKKNVANLNGQQPAHKDDRNENTGQTGEQRATNENAQRQTARSGRKSRDNFGSYTGY